MSDNLALDEGEQTLPAAITARPLRIRVAHYISNILSPAVVSLPLIVLVASYRARSESVALIYAAITIFFLSVGPLAYIGIGVRLGKFSDIDVSVRTQRIGPFLFGLASALVGLCVLSLMQAPKNLETLMLITIISGAVMMITTLWWKISIHAASLASAMTMLTWLYGTILLPTFLLVVFVSWSRVVLRRHTLAQVVAGSVVSIILAVIILKIRGI